MQDTSHHFTRDPSYDSVVRRRIMNTIPLPEAIPSSLSRTLAIKCVSCLVAAPATPTISVVAKITVEKQKQRENEQNQILVLMKQRASAATATKNPSSSSSWLRLLTKWTIPYLMRDLIGMTIYVILLLPGFLQMLWFYLRVDRIAVQYKEGSCRNTLDVYASTTSDGMPPTQHQRPVVLFLPGGAFLIGYKMWAALFAQALSTFDILVVAADYRNYPFGTVPDMIEDVEDVIQWTLDHCHEYGGNPDKVVLVGQSAGAHLGMMALLRQQERYSNDKKNEKKVNIKGFIGLSGIFDLSAASDLYACHGLSEAFVEEKLFGNDLQRCDPMRVVTKAATTTGYKFLPPIEIWHGTADKTVDWRSSKAFAFKLEQACHHTPVRFKSYPNWTHTDPIIEAIFEGNHALHYDICQCVESWCKVTLNFEPPANSPRCPRLLVQWARKFSPF